MYPHRIRLRGPWEYEPLARVDGTGAPSPGSMTMPCRWHAGGLADFSGKVRFRRRFGFPSRIDTHERVWLTFAGADRSAEVWLNGTFLGRHDGDGPFEFEITGLLQARNELRIDLEGSAQRGGLWGEVALEIRCTAYLRCQRFETTVKDQTVFLYVHGEVVGMAERPLELYLLLDGTTVAYATIPAAPEGQPFQLNSEGLEKTIWEARKPHHVQIDLVNGASVWYRDERFQ